MLPTYVVLDVETVASERAEIYYRHAKYSAPVNYKDPEKIEQWILQAKAKDRRKAGLYWWTGQVICCTIHHPDHDYVTLQGADEAALLRAINARLDTYPPGWTLIGKQADSFDRPFLTGRCLAHEIPVHPAIAPHYRIGDVNDIFGRGQWCNQRSTLGDYAFGMNYAGKLAHGSDVQGWWDQIQLGDESLWARVADYCSHDVKIVRELLRRFHLPHVPLTGRTSIPAPIAPSEIPFG